MQYAFRTPQNIQRTDIQLPPSKSIYNRVLVINALAGGQIMQEKSNCDDTRVTLEALHDNPEVVDIGAAGTAMRFLTAYYAAVPGEHILTGTARMRKRPIGLLVDALKQLGADITYREEAGFPPLHIKGKKLHGGTLMLPGDVSSQYISALLMIAPTLSEGLTLTLTGSITSRPYIDLTLNLMRDYGATASWQTQTTLHVVPKPYTLRNYPIEGDWSGASYWFEWMAACPHNVEFIIHPLFPNSYQGDAKVRDLFEHLGVSATMNRQALHLVKSGATNGEFVADLRDQPDLAQTLVVTCALLDRPFRFSGLHTLKIKETDRIHALRSELKKLGYVISETDGAELHWNGERCTPDAMPQIETYEDHRMAMAFAPCIFKYPNLRIVNPDVVTKSYPSYWEDVKKLGIEISRE